MYNLIKILMYQIKLLEEIMKLNQWLEEWQKSYIKFYVKYRTLFCYNNLIKNHIKPILGDYELEELLPNVL
ncbi:MAG: hypothetical protein IJW82_05060, partial [Clostridia bacterium]|nr:hypothetical protein [Clostridia bacterium]